MGNAELHALYEERLNAISAPSFSAMRSTAKELLFEQFDAEAREMLWEELKHGVAVIDREELLWQYLYSYGPMHQSKMNMALEKLPRIAEIVKDGFSVVDWGCGQGLATVCLLDFLREKKIDALPESTVLVEPSELAIENARLHVELCGVENVRLVPKLLDDVMAQDVETDSAVTIHLFSNILDVTGFDLRKLARLIGDNAEGVHYFVCVSPIYGRERRLDAFKEYFTGTVDFASESSSRNEVSVIAEEAYDRKRRGRNFTVKLLVFEFVAGQSSIVQVDYYPPVQFFAAYQLDSLSGAGVDVKAAWPPPSWAAFEIAAPFELGGCVYDDVHPLLAVLNNIVTRGLPTKCSPFVESAFEAYGESAVPDVLGSIRYDGQMSEDRAVRFLQARAPIGIARLQKTIIEAIICERLSMQSEEWRVLVRERDVPCAALAFADLSQMLAHLAALTRDYKDFRMPKVDLTVVGSERWADSPLHLGADVRTEADEALKVRKYDLVIDVSTSAAIDEQSLGFSEFKARNDCYFVIGSTDSIRASRRIYTSDTIMYTPLGENNRRGEFEDDPEQVEHLTYFLNLLFRKRRFRPGQTPILNRALQNKNVIGLLPTGGGKSLTYQLAAMLQPGVTIVVDPLRSLMQDQYEGLVDAGIDSCAFINSTITTAERRAAERRMETSELQFVFLSPERLCIYEFRERLQTMHEMSVYFAYGVIDEVHCVSEWGHDFRFSYLHLGRNMYNYVHTKDMEKRLTLFGLTATASFDVLADVERELSGAGAYPLDANTIVRYENTDRLELQYKIDRVPASFSESRWPDLGGGLPKARFISSWQANESKSDYLATHLLDIPAEIEELQSKESIERIRRRFAERQNEPEEETDELLGSGDLSGMFEERPSYAQGGIVFCPHRKSTGVSVDKNKDALAGTVPDIGTFVGSSDDDRERDEESFRNLSRFKNNEQPLMIATKAFGMGIDKPNVRFTVNMNYPSSLESFVQEAGRAGRDRRISLATILVGDYRFARVRPDCPIDARPIPAIAGRWYNEADLATILANFGVSVPEQYIETAGPEDDWVMAQCADETGFDDKEERKRKRKLFESCRCSQAECASFGECALKGLPPEARGWHRFAEIEGYFDKLRIPKTNLAYMNADYGNNMFFYNNNFLGERAEKMALYSLFCQTPTEVFLGDTVERAETHTVPSLLNAVLSLEVGEELVAFVEYGEEKSDNGRSYSSAQKAIYRMCCFGFVDDFTQDYTNKEFRLVMRRKADGEYYSGLRQFLTRYYADDRASELVAEVPGYRGENEVQKCLGYLTEFIYGKIAVKRKRALDDVRAFCAMGANSNEDWKETNEDLKDFIYYYFNSKYARDEYVADNGEPFSLTADTDRGRQSPAAVTLKYLRVVDEDLVGAGGTPIDNVKHLQGATRLIRRSLTDSGNPCIELLNYFCLTQLGTSGSEALEQELRSDYLSGMTGFAERFESQEEFWHFKERFDAAVETAPHRYDLTQLSELQDEITARVHLAALREIRQTYYGD
ncbi:DEAD/DEAH box helicase [Slackia isoflavoniconvertens]|uniref:DEAD/DEAH box helicase n=1 Tax=Slackia isoflavoniconvertens TaxID=572010 RepID=UPI00307AE766